MKRLVALVIFLVAVTDGVGAGPDPKTAAATLQDGDILFQSLPHSPLVDSIEGCTGSPYSHCGIAHRSGAVWSVIEAIGPVREIPLEQWVRQSRDGHFTAYRLREPYRPWIAQMIAATRPYFGRPYDIAYQFDDEKIYCSELIFKAFRAATGEDLGRVQQLGELDWKPRQAVIEKINGGPVPLDRRMITPRALSEASQLERVGTDLPH